MEPYFLSSSSVSHINTYRQHSIRLSILTRVSRETPRISRHATVHEIFQLASYAGRLLRSLSQGCRLAPPAHLLLLVVRTPPSPPPSSLPRSPRAVHRRRRHRRSLAPLGAHDCPERGVNARHPARYPRVRSRTRFIIDPRARCRVAADGGGKEGKGNGKGTRREGNSSSRSHTSRCIHVRVRESPPGHCDTRRRSYGYG